VTVAPHQLPPNPPGLDRHRSPLSRLVYRLCWLGGKWVQLNTLRVRVLNREMLDTPGGYQLACSHLSHLEPFVLSMVARRPIDWMTRIEFYRRPMISWLLTRLSAIPVRRQGCSASAVRTAIQRVKAGRVVGICPEGGVLTGSESACRCEWAAKFGQFVRVEAVRVDQLPEERLKRPLQLDRDGLAGRPPR
jgi:1-acyl-sn-glycerol-3-phosphate acyltransferase